MKNLFSFLFGLILVSGFVLVISAPVLASPPSQVYYQTPTPDADGRVIYTVKGGDSCLSISLLTGLDINQLRSLNNLNEDCALLDGQKLVLAVITEPSATPGPSPTPTPPQPTPTPFNGNGQICVLLFGDINGNAIAETNELGIAGGVVSVSDNQGRVSLTGNTTSEVDADGVPIPVCFDNIPEGEYNISVALPEGYNSTTIMNYALKLNAGDQSTVDFGAQPNSAAEPAATGGGGRSPVLAILGALLILGGGGLGAYFVLLRRKPPLS